MMWHTDKVGGQWTATVTPDGGVRLLRQTTKPPYRDGGEATLEYQTIEFDPRQSDGLSNTLSQASDEALNMEVPEQGGES